MANLLADAQNNLRNWGNVYQKVRSNDERLREDTQEFSREGVNDENGQVNPAGVQIEEEHNRMNSGLDASLLTALQTFDDHLEISVASARNTFIDRLFDQNAADEDDVQIKSRGSTYGATAADVGNTGDSVLYVCGTDRNDDVIESATIETLTFSALGAASGEADLGVETWAVDGNGKDQRSEFLAGGTGTRITGLTAIGPGRSATLSNPSWDLAFVGTGVNKIQGWEIPAGDPNVALNLVDFAQDRGETAGCLDITGNCIIRFNFRKEDVGLTYLLPFIAGVLVQLVAVTADVEVRLGSTGTAYLNNQSHAAVTQAYTPQVLDPDTADAWRNNFDTDGEPFFEIEVSNYVGGTIRLDDAWCEPMGSVGGRPVAIVSGLVVTIEGDKHTQGVTLDTGAGSVELTGGGAGSVDAITVDGVDIIDAVIPFNTTLAQTAQDAVDNINSFRTFPNYIANRTGDFINIVQEIPVEGSFSVGAVTTTITTALTSVTGASLGEIQDSLVRRSGKYLPHAGSASSGWEDHA